MSAKRRRKRTEYGAEAQAIIRRTSRIEEAADGTTIMRINVPAMVAEVERLSLIAEIEEMEQALDDMLENLGTE